ncbi:MAG: DNA-directed RNA polymerase subunit alpha C-terminal domain-containing protein [Planctomycetota bacterium]
MTSPAATSAPARQWLQSPPTDWAGWLAFLAEANAHRVQRDSLRDWLSTHVDGGTQPRLLGLGLCAAGEPTAALPHLLAAKDELCSLLAGQIQSGAGDETAALATWQELVGSSKVGQRARLMRLASQCRRRDREAAATEFAALKTTKPSAADLAYAEGLVAEAAGDHINACAHWRQAVQHDPAHDEARFRLAMRTALDDDEDEVIALYRDSLDKGRLVTVGMLMNLGVAYEDREEYDAAARCFRAVLQADPTNARARRYLADAEASRRQFYDETRERKADIQSAVLRIPVTDFELSVRARNCLQRMNIHTLGDLICRTEAELLSFKNFGETSLQEVKDILVLKGLRLGMSNLPRGALPLPEDDFEDDELLEIVAEPVADDGDVRHKKIADLDLSVRSRAALTTLGIATLGQLAETSEQTLLACKNFGQTSLVEIKTKLRENGLELAT